MVKRTSMLLDPALVADAAHALGTRGTSETVREALRRAIRAEKLHGLASWDLPDDAPARLEALRAARHV